MKTVLDRDQRANGQDDRQGEAPAFSCPSSGALKARPGVICPMSGFAPIAEL